MVRIRAHSVQDNDIRFQGGQTARCLLNWSQLWEPGTRLKTYTWRSLSGFGSPPELCFTSCALMNNSVHVTWGSWTVAGQGLYCSSGQERGREDVSHVYVIHTETVHPFEEEGKWVRDCLLFLKKLETLECFPQMRVSCKDQLHCSVFCSIFFFWTFNMYISTFQKLW